MSNTKAAYKALIYLAVTVAVSSSLSRCTVRSVVCAAPTPPSIQPNLPAFSFLHSTAFNHHSCCHIFTNTDMDTREPLDCGWMVPPGSYQDMVRNLIESDPGLLRRERKRTMDGPVRALVFELPRSKPAHLPTPITLNSAEELRQHVDKADSVAQRVNSIYILENLNRGSIEILGRHFSLHPSIFLDYIRTTQVPGCKKGYSSLLASTCATRDYLVLNYRELLALPDEAASLERLRCAHTGRDIATTFINCDLDMVGVVSRRAVLWSRQRTTKDGWDCELQ
jgi:hypothetical protein